MISAPPKLATIDEACSLVTDGTHYTPMEVEAGIPFLTVKDMADRSLDFVGCSFISEPAYRAATLANCAPKMGDVLFSKDGTVGKVHVVTTDRPFAVLSSVAILRPHDEVDARYLAHVLRSPSVLAEATRRKTGSAIRRIVLSDLRRVRIPVPSLGEQRRIAHILDRADALRAKRQAGLVDLEGLEKATFLHMFGDPARNPQGWRRVTLGDVVKSASDGPHVSPVYVDDGIPFLSTRHVRAGAISWTDLKFISQTDAEIHWRKCKPERGDILFTKGGTTGLAAVVDTDDAFAVWVHIALLKPDIETVDPWWLEGMLNSDFCYRQSQRLTHGIANRDLGLTRMVQISIPLPPLDLQRSFAATRRRIGILRNCYSASLAELDAMFASLQQWAFRGEL